VTSTRSTREWHPSGTLHTVQSTVEIRSLFPFPSPPFFPLPSPLSMSGKYRLPGYYGLTIYGILFLYTFLRILQSIFSQPTNQIKYLNYKLGFHFVFALFCLFEGIYSYSLTIDDRSGRLTTLLLSLPLTMIQHHLVGIFLPFCCFIFQCGFFFIGPLSLSLFYFPPHPSTLTPQIVNLWGYSLNFYQCYWKFSLLSSILIFVNFVAFVVSVVYIGTLPQPPLAPHSLPHPSPTRSEVPRL
jgi:hypothetical protein